ncbi:hypothetical protein PR202_gn00390 [Eleusine coracana subsp. coracana]|uniref:Uncharacterized protein n=1 Tax=Eleusine coracana subsp. coracana TaxID=191504 RepID=A0AAV5G3D6_ELECO|nr:hypothetical protein PR202_gn00390 [Eleusine coracana subsp. coracana]
MQANQCVQALCSMAVATAVGDGTNTLFWSDQWILGKRIEEESIPVTQLVRETAAVMQEFTQSGGVRPFGVSLLIAGYDDNGPQLYQVDPSGSYFSWKASAMGKNVSNAKTFLEKSMQNCNVLVGTRYTEDMELDDAIHTAILTLKEGYEGQISSRNIEIGIIRSDREFNYAFLVL